MGVTVREKPKGSGKYWVFISHNGHRKSKSIGSKKEARKIAKQLEARLAHDDLGCNSKKIPRLKEYGEKWIEDYVAECCKPSTYERYKQIFENCLLPQFGNEKLDKISRRDVREFLLMLSKNKKAKKSIGLIKDVLSGILGQAVDDELINNNPTTNIMKRLKLKSEKQQIESFTKEEVSIFLKTCEKYRPDWYPFFFTAFRTGLRLGEVIALHWTDINFAGKHIIVQRSFRRVEPGKTKNGKTRRVDMSEQLLKVLNRYQIRLREKNLKSGKDEITEIVFPVKDGYASQNSIRNIWKALLAKAGLDYKRFHDIRHTYASLLLSNEASPVYVKEQMGHYSIQITVDTYGHLIPGGNIDLVNRLDEHLNAPYMHPTKEKRL